MKIPLNFDGTKLTGGLHTSGKAAGRADEDQYYYIFWVSHIDKVYMSGGLNKNDVIERFKISAEEFDDKLELNEFFCKVCNKESNTAFARLAKYGDKTCRDCLNV